MGRSRFVFAFILALAGCSEVRPRAGQNVLLVTVDTLRADRLGAYGYASARTPNIDALASRGVLFEDALAQVPLTLPSHASLFTGLAPPTHGVRDNTYFRLDDEAVTLAEVLKERGYETAAFVGAFVLDRSFGLEQGFDLYDDQVEGGAESVGTIAERTGEVVARRFTEWLERRSPDRPFFAWVHFFDPHLPYARGGYDGEIAYVDEQVGAILERLDDDTLVVLTSDHGESLGEHGEKSHGFFVYDATLRVPLVLSGPSLPEGARVAEPVRLIDVSPTLLEALEAPLPREIQGRSLLPLIAGEAAEPPLLYAECYVPELNFGWAPLLALREGSFKYIEAPRPELYDLESDPGETRNLIGSEPERASRMRRLLRERIESFPGSLSSRLQPDPETIERLRSLGYATSGGGRGSESAAERPDPKDRLHLWTRLEEVILARGAGKHDQAVEGALEVLEEDPTNLLALELLAGARADSGDRSGAIETYRRILAIDDSRPLSRVLYGNLLWQSGDLEGAEESFARAIELDSGFARAHRRLGELYLTRGEHARALESFRAAGAVSGEGDVEIGLGLARALRASGDGDGAMKALERLRERHPQDPEVLAEYAGTLAQRGDSDRALSLLARGPDHHDVHFTASVILRSRDRMEEALRELDRALSLEPSSAVALHDRGVILSRMGRLPEAVESLEKALALSDAPATRNALGTALCRMERCAEGIPHFERAVEQAPGMVEAWENLAAAYALEGREADARRVEMRIQEINAAGRPLP